jgi:hypothetical protein
MNESNSYPLANDRKDPFMGHLCESTKGDRIDTRQICVTVLHQNSEAQRIRTEDSQINVLLNKNYSKFTMVSLILFIHTPKENLPNRIYVLVGMSSMDHGANARNTYFSENLKKMSHSKDNLSLSMWSWFMVIEFQYKLSSSEQI